MDIQQHVACLAWNDEGCTTASSFTLGLSHLFNAALAELALQTIGKSREKEQRAFHKHTHASNRRGSSRPFASGQGNGSYLLGKEA